LAKEENKYIGEYMKYDDFSWHFEGDYSKNTPKQNGATHIAMFLGWAISRNEISTSLYDLSEQAAKALQDVINKKITPRTYIIKYCDGVLLSDYLSEEINNFAENYYEKLYLKDYLYTFPYFKNMVYKVPNIWENYDLILLLLDNRLKEWKSNKQFMEKPIFTNKKTILKKLFLVIRTNKNNYKTML
jgi:hypothetical protein